MDLYDRIQSPLDDDKTIETLVKIYAERGDINYNDIVTNGENKNIDRDQQFEEFDKNILKECIEMENEYLSEFSKKYNIALYTKDRNEKLKALEDKLEEFRKNNHYDIVARDKCRDAFFKIGLYPVDAKKYYEEHETDLKKYNITEDDINRYMNYNDLEEVKLKDEIESFERKNLDYDTIIKTLNKYTSEEIIEILEYKKSVSDEEMKNIITIRDYLESRHNFNDEGIMGFHIYKDMFEDIDEAQKKDESKLYINADYDQVYKIARLYLEKARERGINYSFKVNYPRFDAVNRADKFVVFSPLKELTKNVEVLDEILREHPEFTLKNPGLLVGKLENGIGIGMDSKGKSYNRRRSDFLNKIFNKIFKDKSSDEVKNMIKSEKGIISKIKDKIKNALTKSGISTEKFCLDKEKEQDFKKITGKDNKDENKKEPQKDEKDAKEANKKESQEDEKDAKKEANKEESQENEKDTKNVANNEELQENKKDGNKENSQENQKDVKEEIDEEKRDRQQNESDENQKKMQALIKNMNKLTKRMANDYINANYENEQKNRELYQSIVDSMVKLRVLQGGTKISKLDMMMEKRRLDATASNLVFAYRDHEGNLKYKRDTAQSNESVKYELKKLEEYLKSDIELQDGTRIKVYDEEEKDSTQEKESAESKESSNSKSVDESKVTDKSKTTDKSKKTDKSKTTDQSKKTDKSKTTDQSKKTDKSKTVDQSKKTDKSKTTDQSKKTDKSKTTDKSKKTDKSKTTDESKKTDKSKTTDESKKTAKSKTSDKSKESVKSINQEKKNKKNGSQSQGSPAMKKSIDNLDSGDIDAEER